MTEEERCEVRSVQFLHRSPPGPCTPMRHQNNGDTP